MLLSEPCRVAFGITFSKTRLIKLYLNSYLMTDPIFLSLLQIVCGSRLFERITIFIIQEVHPSHRSSLVFWKPEAPCQIDRG